MKGYLMFALIGFALGTLFAPKKGSVLRKEIKDGIGDMKKNGTEAFEEVQRKSEQIVEKASQTLEQAKKEAMTLQRQSQEMVRSAFVNLQGAYDRSQSALHLAGERASGETAPFIAKVRDEAKGRIYLTTPQP